MRNSMRIGVTAVLCTLLGACASGPHQLRRSVDDWDHQVYVNSPWLNAAMWVVPIYPTCHAVALVLDFAITDPWYFWCEDAWDGSGTGFQHLDVEWTDGHVDSLLSDRSGWTRTER
ncbi:MAG: hypothetical protein KAI24_03795 [Planctomycetes bacterium]|nr:hypothetical protein [Planctomycetota bacterium]